MGSDGLVTQMRKGALEYCVMALLGERPKYGFELVQQLAGIEGLLTSEGTLYPLLGRLRRDGLVETEWRESQAGPPRRYYALTRKGDAAIDDFRQEWALFRGAVDEVLRKGGQK